MRRLQGSEAEDRQEEMDVEETLRQGKLLHCWDRVPRCWIFADIIFALFSHSQSDLGMLTTSTSRWFASGF
jgi:hypothetical protein